MKLKIPLSPQHFSIDDVLSFHSGIRPFRKRGIRLESEKMGTKWVIHNYGHGGSGTSLSWGSAKYALDLFKKCPIYKENLPAVVLGSGVIGLTLASLLTSHKHPVRIIASRFSPETTSDVAPAIWDLFLVDRGNTFEEKKSFEKIALDSYEFFKDLCEERFPEFSGVSHLDIYAFIQQQVAPDPLLDRLMGFGTKISATFDQGKQKEGYFYSTFLIETKKYLEDLIRSLKNKRVSFIQKEIVHLDELQTLEERVIFNCTGHGAAQLFQDLSVIPVRGHLVHLKKKSPMKAMICEGEDEERISFYMIPLSDRVILGGSSEFHISKPDVDANMCSKILSRANKFLQS